ncbi:CYTH domain-containing protein [Streptomyces scabiei]|uniref:CYTH domain-containing protein n=1 Tax=Streptomyces scabiei TaxID=1930 RepID=UPI001B30356E|nr:MULTISPECIES: CYTH domain-containing protein [Streptomyces]MDX3121581.1 CYTH domain-containing protein [Streptomyces scabiei]MDX3520385.1 CYTH domain-containing protein [Streptomyces scabiei]QTU46851.1 CYTH domain-containing protein [Streptomyces sp. LBUM 1482]
MSVEIEMRARFSQEAHDQLISRLEQDGEDLGRDDKHIYFYVLPDQLLKVTDNIATNTAKITLKTSKIGQGAAFPETEIAIGRQDVEAAVRVFNALGFEHTMHDAYNERRNFRFRGVEIAVKWSEAWSHHAEFEVLLGDDPSQAEVDAATERIETVAKELGVILMSETELASFTAAFEATQRDLKSSTSEATPAS